MWSLRACLSGCLHHRQLRTRSQRWARGHRPADSDGHSPSPGCPGHPGPAAGPAPGAGPSRSRLGLAAHDQGGDQRPEQARDHDHEDQRRLAVEDPEVDPGRPRRLATANQTSRMTATATPDQARPGAGGRPPCRPPSSDSRGWGSECTGRLATGPFCPAGAPVAPALGPRPAAPRTRTPPPAAMRGVPEGGS